MEFAPGRSLTVFKKYEFSLHWPDVYRRIPIRNDNKCDEMWTEPMSRGVAESFSKNLLVWTRQLSCEDFFFIFFRLMSTLVHLQTYGAYDSRVGAPMMDLGEPWKACTGILITVE